MSHEVPEPELAPAVIDAESARYALLRRLAPSMRHHLVVNLQPIGMIYEVMDRRLRAPEPQLADVQESAHKINGFARAALNSCLDVVTWLAPEEEKVTTVADGVGECLGLLATSFTFRGFALRNEGAAATGSVRRSAIRNVLAASLIHITDESKPPAQLVLSTEAGTDSVVVALTVKPTDGEAGFAPEAPYRKLAWGDVQALADSESVVMEREGRRVVRMTFPLARSVKT